MVADEEQESESGEGVEIPPEALEPETLRRIIEEFVLREGTDYGHADFSLDQKVKAVEKQLREGKVLLTYSAAEGTVNLVTRQRR